MAKLTLIFALVLIVLGIAVFVATGSHARTALIPTWFGVVLGILSLLANTDDAKRRMLFMHIAVSVGLIGFISPVGVVSETLLLKAMDRQFYGQWQ